MNLKTIEASISLMSDAYDNVHYETHAEDLVAYHTLKALEAITEYLYNLEKK